MHQAPGSIASLFTANGGVFLTPVVTMAEKMDTIKAFVFDWDGVFNDGVKQTDGSSSFSEVDAMGVNLLRFAYWLHHGQLPLTAIITGERNETSLHLAAREHFDACYYRTGNKQKSLDDLCRRYSLQPSEIAFVFDDVLDFPIANVAGLRFFIPRAASPLMAEYVRQNGLADYLICAPQFFVREACELMIGLLGNYDETVQHRTDFSSRYQQYLSERNAVETLRFTMENGSIIQK